MEREEEKVIDPNERAKNNENDLKDVGFLKSLFTDYDGAISSRTVTLFLCLFFIFGEVIFHEIRGIELRNGRLEVINNLIYVVMPICLCSQVGQNFLQGFHKRG